MNNKIYFLILLLLLNISLPIQFVMADTTLRSPSLDGLFTAGPYYNPKTKSYFELVNSEKISWKEAEFIASNRKYKNASGKLASITNISTHRFLVNKFSFNRDTWIGLQFSCNEEKLLWSNGNPLTSNQFSNWHLESNYQSSMCLDSKFIPTFIMTNSFSWQVGPATKTSEYFLVEYATGKP